MIQSNIQIFSDWYFKKEKLKTTNYPKDTFRNNPLMFMNDISAWSKEYNYAFMENPFDKNYQGMTFTFITTLNTNLLGLTKIEGYNKLYGSNDEMTNFILNNYIPFLVSLLYGDDLDLYKLNKEMFIANAKLPFRNEFNSWLIESKKFTKGSAMSYCTYVKGINDNVMFDLNYPNMFFKIINKLVDEQLFQDLFSFLNNYLKGLKNKKERPNYKRYTVGLQCYMIFLEQKFVINDVN